MLKCSLFMDIIDGGIPHIGSGPQTLFGNNIF